MDLQLTDKRALVLASSSGLGQAAAAALAREGARVTISSSNQDHLAAARTAMLEATGVEADRIGTVVCDLTEPDAVPDAIETATEGLGGLDVLVTNTGLIPKLGFESVSIEQFDETYVFQLKSIVVAIRTALPALTDGYGAITNIIAAAAQRPEANHVLANTFRPGIFGLAKSLANEYADVGLRVNCVCPKKVGPVTPQERERASHVGRYAEEHGLSYDAAREAYIAETIPLGGHGDLEEFGNAVAFVSSPQASHITGTSLNVDGGWNPRLF